MFFSLISLYLSGNFGGSLELFLLLKLALLAGMFAPPLIFNLLQKLVFIDIAFLSLSFTQVQIYILIAVALFLDGLVDKRIFEVFALGEGTDVGLLVLGLVVHQHIVILNHRHSTFLYEIYFMRSAYLPCSARSLNSLFSSFCRIA